MVSQVEEEKRGGEIFRLIPQIMRAIGSIGKDRRNQAQGYSFRGIDDLYNAVHGPLSTAGVFVVPNVLEVKREERERVGRDGRPSGAMFYVTLTVRHTFYASDGSSFDATTVGEAMDTGDKASNKAMSAAMKYALLEVFAIPTEGDNDTENHSLEVAPRTAVPTDTEKFDIRLMEVAEGKGFDVHGLKRIEAKVCSKKQVARVADLSPSDRESLIKAIADGKFDNLKGVVAS